MDKFIADIAFFITWYTPRMEDKYRIKDALIDFKNTPWKKCEGIQLYICHIAAC